MRHVVLLGTSHNYQYGGTRCKPDEFEAFKGRLRQASKVHQVAAIAEEMSTDGLKEVGVIETSCSMVARELAIPHRYCDPGQIERNALGIGSDLEMDRFYYNWREEEFLVRQEFFWNTRMTYWLDQLKTFDSWPVLFVCGSTHTETFASILNRSAVGVTVADLDWKPDTRK